jgi:hypothetical protein
VIRGGGVPIEAEAVVLEDGSASGRAEDSEWFCWSAIV